MFSSYIRELTWSPGHSFVLRYVLLESLPVRGSFAVQFGDHFPSGDHLRACTDVLLSGNALSQSLSFPAPLDKGNEGSGNEIGLMKWVQGRVRADHHLLCGLVTV